MSVPATTVLDLVASAVFAYGLMQGSSVWRGTTLTAPRRWACGALIGLVAMECWIAWTDAADSRRLIGRYATDSLLLTPFISLLGAKRPQDQGWQWIVLSLWGILLVPLAQWTAFGQGTFRLHLSWQVFVVVLLAAQTVNFVGTTQFGAALLWSLGQACLLAPVLARIFPLSALVAPCGPEWLRVAGLILLAAAPWVASVVAGRWERRGRSWDRVWFDFRDAYGAAWGLRVLDRVNQSAELGEWPLRLTWPAGFGEPSGNPPSTGTVNAELTHQIDQALRTVLRRFVSPNWLNDRLPIGPSPESAE